MNMKVFGSLALSSLFGVSFGADITNDVYNLRNVTKNDSGTFTIQSTQTYKSSNGSFTQNYNNATLIFGNTAQNTGSGRIWFGGSGWHGGSIGYITASFNAKDAYLTGTLGAGNSLKTGGGASLNFNASNNITMQDLKLQFDKAGTQNSQFNLAATQKIIAKNLTISDSSGGTASFNAKDFDFHAKNITSDGTIKFTSTNGSQSGKVTLDSLNISSGYFYSDGFNGDLDIKALNINNTTFKTKHLDFSSITASNTSYKESKDSTGNTLSLNGKWNLGNGTIKNLSSLDFSDTLTLSGDVKLDNVSKVNLNTLDLNGGNLDTTASKQADIAIKNLKISKGTFKTVHFTNQALSISQGASFKQSQDDTQGYADITTTGTYSVASGAFSFSSQMSFIKLNNLNAESLSAKTWGAYNSSITLDSVKNAKITTLTLAQNSSADTAYPTFDATKSNDLKLEIENLNSSNGIFKTSNTTTTTINHANLSSTTFETAHFKANSISTENNASYKENTASSSSNLTTTGKWNPQTPLPTTQQVLIIFLQ